VTSPKESGTPGTITAGYWLVVTGSVLSVLASIFLLMNRQAAIDALKQRNTDPNVTDEVIRFSATLGIVVALVVTVVVGLFAVWFAVKVKRGVKKSRTGLMILLFITLFFQMIANPYAIATALIAIAGLVLFYFRQSADYLAEHEQAS
jgi:uncharacterized membrane protein YhaH (DUF805 family)